MSSLQRPVDGLAQVKELKSWFRNFLIMLVTVCTANSPNCMETQKCITVNRKAATGLYPVPD
jgi:hypothetical protein